MHSCANGKSKQMGFSLHLRQASASLHPVLSMKYLNHDNSDQDEISDANNASQRARGP